MKRIDHDGHERQGPPPFRVLPDTAYLSPVLPTPPPPRAPEPYKVVPSATRAQRRSTSFVILAESRPISPEAGGNAATLPAGRISPFRGRGFKEPPPRLSVSRPQSPDTAGRRRGRVERRASASEQSSPRKSLIPQPTYRQRSTSLTKVNEQKTTERRGADSRARLGNSRSRPNVSGSQGRLNAPDARNARTPNEPRARPGRLESSRSGRPLAEPRTRFISNSTSDLNGGTTARRSQAAAKSPLSPIQGTPTKPTEKATASEAGARGRGSSRSSPTKTPSRSSPQKNATGREGASRGSRERVVSPSKIPVKTGKANGTCAGPDERQPGDPAEPESQDKNLINLLRQTAAVNASGTSSEQLVNTTTTTAVQPLQIDAASGVPPTDVRPPTKEGASRSPASRDDAPPALVATPGAPNQSSALPEGQSARASAPASDRRDGLRPGEGRAPTGSQPTASRRREEASSTASTETPQAKSGSAGRKVTANREGLPEAEKMLPTVTESEPRVASQERKAAATTATTTTTTTETIVGNAATSDATRADKAAGSRESNPAPDAERASVNSRVLSKNGLRGSQGSLGSTGMSVDSIMSYKSTDTGVSLNTFVRVSSPREKVGVHVMKRPQEIKTLSGDVVREEDGESEKKRRFMAPDGLKQRVRLPWWSKQRSRLRLWWIDWRSKRAQRRPTRISFEKTKTITDAPPPAATPRSIGCRVCCCRRRASDNPPTEFLRRCRVCCCRRRASDNPPAEEAKLPNPLVEHNSHMRGAIPCLPLPLAWFCLVWNVLLPGTGTIWSGLFNLCFGQPRFSPVAGIKSRLGAFIINLVVGVSQMFTVLFCFVGWGWSIWWGITMIRLARKYKRFKAFEATRNDAEARAGDPVAGVPTEVLRGAEKGR